MDFEATNKTIYKTTNYDMFKILDGNRSVKNARVVKTVESIEKHGWLTQPILVNEKFEVIDGQGRLEALKRLEMPVEFVIDEGIGIEECRTLNVYQKNWSSMDYIDSWVAMGNTNYIWLKQMTIDFSELPSSVVLAVATMGGDRYGTSNTTTAQAYIKNGQFIKTKDERNESEKELFFLSRFADIVDDINGGRKEHFYSAILFLYRLNIVDNERLVKAVSKNRYDIKAPAGTTEGYITIFEKMYNKGLEKASKVDMVHEYKIA